MELTNSDLSVIKVLKKNNKGIVDSENTPLEDRVALWVYEKYKDDFTGLVMFGSGVYLREIFTGLFGEIFLSTNISDFEDARKMLAKHHKESELLVFYNTFKEHFNKYMKYLYDFTHHYFFIHSGTKVRAVDMRGYNE